MEPFSAGFIRFAVASILLVFVAWRTEGKLRIPGRKNALLLILLGLTGVFTYNVCFYKGLQLINAGRASAIIACNPILIAALSSVFFKEKLSATNIAGIVISVTGAMVVVSRGDLNGILEGGIGKGELLIFGCVASWVFYSLVSKGVMADMPPATVVFYSCVVGTICFFPLACAEGLFVSFRHYPIAAWGAILYTCVFATVIAFVWYCDGITKVGPTRAGLFINFVPISAVLLGFIILHEPITASLALGTTLVCTGVYLTSRR
jgi:drug/metabolite transporter (DMT)-like permease